MDKKIVLIIILLLCGCAPRHGCTNIAMYDYGESHRAIHVYWWEAEYTKMNIIGLDGMVMANRYLGEGSSKDVELCEDPVVLDGWYSVGIPDGGQGEWILVGQGYRNQVDVRINTIHPDDIAKMINKELQP